MAQKSSFWSEFKTFIARGNVMDMAVGVVVGGAFTAIVNSLVGDIINPLIGKLFGGVDLSAAKVVLTEANEATGAAEVAVRYGALIQAILNFLIVALCIFSIVRLINKMKARMEREKREEEAKKKAEEEKKKAEEDALRAEEEAKKAAEQTETVELLRQIRDSLKK